MQRNPTKNTRGPSAEEYKELPAQAKIPACPFCGYPGILFEHEYPPGHAATKVVMCSNNGDEDCGIEECPMFMPPEGFYKATKREAISVWSKRA